MVGAVQDDLVAALGARYGHQVLNEAALGVGQQQGRQDRVGSGLQGNKEVVSMGRAGAWRVQGHAVLPVVACAGGHRCEQGPTSADTGGSLPAGVLHAAHAAPHRCPSRWPRAAASTTTSSMCATCSNMQQEQQVWLGTCCGWVHMLMLLPV